jgi:hypothetical protein
MSDNEMNIDEGVSPYVSFSLSATYSSFKSQTEEALSGKEAVDFKVLRVCRFACTALYVLVLMERVPFRR